MFPKYLFLLFVVAWLIPCYSQEESKKPTLIEQIKMLQEENKRLQEENLKVKQQNLELQAERLQDLQQKILEQRVTTIHISQLQDQITRLEKLLVVKGEELEKRLVQLETPTAIGVWSQNQTRSGNGNYVWDVQVLNSA